MRRNGVVIANCGGFWGDDPTAARRQVAGGHVDYLVMDYLAEITMAILQKQRSAKPKAGYANDFVRQLSDVLLQCVERGIRIITNAGGVNPAACGAAVERLAAELGLADKVKVAVITGDDLMGQIDALIASGESLSHMDTGQPLATLRDRVLSANAYLGAAPIVEALRAGATIVVAGRVTDTAVTLAPMMFEFGWQPDEWDKVAAGVIAGHIIECGTQCTGGNFTDWKLLPTHVDVAFPLIEAYPDGSFVVTKHPNTGGMVTTHTVAEQLLYEMGTPAYISPDAVARFDSVALVQEGPDRVRVSGAKGGPPPDTLKVSISFRNGWRAVGRLVVSGPDTLAKAERVASAFWAAAGGKALYADAADSVVGWNACHPSLATEEPSEALVQFAVRDDEAMKINERFAPHLVARVLSTVPGISYLADQGRPRASEVVGYWPALVSKQRVSTHVTINNTTTPVTSSAPRAALAAPTFIPPPAPLVPPSSGPSVRVRLDALCLARSGDKGDTANIGVIARSPAIYAWMLSSLTADLVKARFAGVCRGRVERHVVPNLLAVNFLLHESLGGGGTLSLLLDSQGKTYAQYLLATTVEVSSELVSSSPRAALVDSGVAHAWSAAGRKPAPPPGRCSTDCALVRCRSVRGSSFRTARTSGYNKRRVLWKSPASSNQFC